MLLTVSAYTAHRHDVDDSILIRKVVETVEVVVSVPHKHLGLQPSDYIQHHVMQYFLKQGNDIVYGQKVAEGVVQPIILHIVLQPCTGCAQSRHRDLHIMHHMLCGDDTC